MVRILCSIFHMFFLVTNSNHNRRNKLDSMAFFTFYFLNSVEYSSFLEEVSKKCSGSNWRVSIKI